MRKIVFLCWKLLDPIYIFLTRRTYINYGKNIFRVRIITYRGPVVTLSNGTRIEKKDLLLKIHLHNVILLPELRKANCDFQKAKIFYHAIKNSLPDLALFLENHPQKDKIKAVVGITSLSLRRNNLGFETIDITNPLYKTVKRIGFMPIEFLSADIFRKRRQKRLDPAYLFMAKEVLFKNYLWNTQPSFQNELKEPVSV